MENRLKTICKGFGNNFVENIIQGYRSKIFHSGKVWNFRNKDNGCFVYLRRERAISNQAMAVAKISRPQAPKFLIKSWA